MQKFNVTGDLVFEKKKDFDIFYDYPGLDISSMTARWKFVENSRC